MSIRPVKQIVQSQPTMEGAGVRLRRAFGFGNTSDFDPFLLLDDFRNELRAFPHGKYDDQADSFSQFVRHQLRRWTWLFTEYEPEGRAHNVVRLERRPW